MRLGLRRHCVCEHLHRYRYDVGFGVDEYRIVEYLSRTRIAEYPSRARML